MTLWEFIQQDSLPHSDEVLLFDDTPYPDHHIPGVLFDGTVDQLIAGVGDNYLIDCHYDRQEVPVEEIKEAYSEYLISEIKDDGVYHTLYVQYIGA
jgi:hypothetical protein